MLGGAASSMSADHNMLEWEIFGLESTFDNNFQVQIGVTRVRGLDRRLTLDGSVNDFPYFTMDEDVALLQANDGCLRDPRN